jgi:hypothetical protein
VPGKHIKIHEDHTQGRVIHARRPHPCITILPRPHPTGYRFVTPHPSSGGVSQSGNAAAGCGGGPTLRFAGVGEPDGGAEATRRWWRRPAGGWARESGGRSGGDAVVGGGGCWLLARGRCHRRRAAASEPACKGRRSNTLGLGVHSPPPPLTGIA